MMSIFTPFYSTTDKRKTTNWNLCCLCQQNTGEELRCPYKKECYHKAYKVLEIDLKNFVNNEVPIPLDVNVECLDDGSGIANTMKTNKATYHNRCRALFRSGFLQRVLKKREMDSANVGAAVSPKKTRLSYKATLDREKAQCVYCEKYEGEGDEQIYRVSSANCGKNLFQWALQSQNWVVHARLNTASNAEDVQASDIHYHASCYTKLKNEARAATKSSRNACHQQTYDPLIIAQLIALVKCNNSPQKVSQMKKWYENRLETDKSDRLGAQVHSTRFKEHLLKKLGSDWYSFNDGKEVYVSHKKTIGAALAETARTQVTEDEADKIVDVAVLLRKYIIFQQMPFNGSFSSDCLSEPVAKPLLTLINVMLQGSSTLEETITDDDQADMSARIKVAYTISQLICSNSTNQPSQAVTLYQRKDRETPFPLYLGLKLHSNDRQKENIRTLHALGISVSYDRVMEVRKQFAQAVCKRWQKDGVIVPINIKRKVFVTTAVDNIDESGRYELHGTAMSLTSHPTSDNIGEDPPPFTLNISDESTSVELPDSYTIAPFVDEYTGDVFISGINNASTISDIDKNDELWMAERNWLQHVNMVVKDNDGQLQETPVTYSGFFSHGQNSNDVRPRSTVGVFPILYEKSATMAMQKHSMNIAIKATDFVNPGQIPVLVGDCPLYALQKKCQWVYPEEVGESKLVCFMGLLHVEMASQECVGKLLAGSGWDRMFSIAKIMTSGIASSLLGGKHVKRTRHAYQLTLAWLHVLEVEAYKQHCQEVPEPHESMEVWEKSLTAKSPTVHYWVTVRDFLLLICRLVRGQRVGNWTLTMSSCEELCPWFFVFGHTNYSRWLPVFLNDMSRLQHTHPSVHEAFMKGQFVVQRSEKKFSLMALDQSHEHSIQFLKADSGPKGLYGQKEEKEVIEISKPEVLRVIDDFERNLKHSSVNNQEHQESSTAEQTKFLKHLKALLNVVRNGTIVNPFKETGTELVTLDTGEVMDPVVARCLKEAKETGETMYKNFVRDRIQSATKPISDTIPRSTIYTFSNRPPANLKKGPSKLGTAKANAALITKLFISLQARPQADIDDFFRHENQRDPPSLSKAGKLLSGMKSALLQCLPGMPGPGGSQSSKEASVLVLDMAAVIHIIKPQGATVFGEYTNMYLLPFIESKMTPNTTRVDAVWDTYPDGSLKSQTRDKRGDVSGRRTRVSAKTPIPKGSEWVKFLSNSNNKQDLFNFLSEKLAELTTGASYQLFTTKGNQVLSNRTSDISTMSPSQQEEADTRMMLHLQHAAEQGHAKAYLRTVDTDVVVLAIYHFKRLNMSELWIGFGSGKTFKDIPIHHICQQLGPERSEALLFFHAFTGCDVTSSMHGIGKKTAWNAWDAYPEITDTFIDITNTPNSLTLESQHMSNLERFTVLMYSRNCGADSVNDARKLMFTQGLKSLESIPPTQRALFQHTKRSLLTTAFIWKMSLSESPDIPDYSKWGWEWNDRSKEWVPYWTDLPGASHGCSLLLNCGCLVSCIGRCKCYRAGIRCSPLCKCQEGCTNNSHDT